MKPKRFKVLFKFLYGFNRLIFFRKDGPRSYERKILSLAGYGVVNAEDNERKDSDVSHRRESVSYTHLTLPTT